MSDVATFFTQFHKSAENQLGYSLNVIKIDVGREFKSDTFYLAQYGITHILTCPYTYEKNGIVERKYTHKLRWGLLS